MTEREPDSIPGVPEAPAVLNVPEADDRGVRNQAVVASVGSAPSDQPFRFLAYEVRAQTEVVRIRLSYAVDDFALAPQDALHLARELKIAARKVEREGQPLQSLRFANLKPAPGGQKPTRAQRRQQARNARKARP